MSNPVWNQKAISPLLLALFTVYAQDLFRFQEIESTFSRSSFTCETDRHPSCSYIDIRAIMCSSRSMILFDASQNHLDAVILLSAISFSSNFYGFRDFTCSGREQHPKSFTGRLVTE